MANFNRVLLKGYDHNGRQVTTIANDDRHLNAEQMQEWADRMNGYLKRTGAWDRGARYYLG